jgi:membrane-associated phospholipid phosphatase
VAQDEASAASRLFIYNWIPVGLMALTLGLCLTFTGFSIKPSSAIPPYSEVGILAGIAYCYSYFSGRRDAIVPIVLGSTAQILLIVVLMTPMTYVVAAIDLPMQDANLEYLDRVLGFDWRAYYHFICSSQRLVAAAVLAYSVILLPIFGIPVVLGMAGRHRRLQEFTLAFTLALVTTTIISAFVPAIGTYDQLGIKPDPAIFTPAAYLDQLRDLPMVRDGSLRQLDLLGLTGIITFPSFHAAMAVLCLWAWWSVWWMRPFALIANLGMLLATPLIGGHYFVDVFAGMAVAAVAIAVAIRLGERLTETVGAPVLVPASTAK